MLKNYIILHRFLQVKEKKEGINVIEKLIDKNKFFFLE